MIVDTGLNDVTYHDVHVPIDKHARLYEEGQQIALKDLRPGSWLTLIVHTTALKQAWATETMQPDQITPLTSNGLPIGASVEGAIQHVYNPSYELKIEETMGTDWTRLVPDKGAPGGWRQVVPLQSKN
jgi:hypothetical protein